MAVRRTVRTLVPTGVKVPGGSSSHAFPISSITGRSFANCRRYTVPCRFSSFRDHSCRTPDSLVEAQQRLRKMVLDTLPSPHSRRNYAKALDDLYAFSAGRPLTRELLMERSRACQPRRSTYGSPLFARWCSRRKRTGCSAWTMPLTSPGSRTSGSGELGWATGSPGSRRRNSWLYPTGPP